MIFMLLALAHTETHNRIHIVQRKTTNTCASQIHPFALKTFLMFESHFYYHTFSLAHINHARMVFAFDLTLTTV